MSVGGTLAKITSLRCLSVRSGEQFQDAALQRIDGAVHVGRAVVTEIAGGVGGQFRKARQSARDHVMHSTMQAIGVVAVVVVFEHHLPVPRIGRGAIRPRPIGQFRFIILDRQSKRFQPRRQGRAFWSKLMNTKPSQISNLNSGRRICFLSKPQARSIAGAPINLPSSE